MLQHQRVGTVVPGLAVPERPERDDARELGGGACIREKRAAVDISSRSKGLCEQAALNIEGEAYACAYLDRLQVGTVSPTDLAVLMAFLHGEMLSGACRVIERALGVRHA